MLDHVAACRDCQHEARAQGPVRVRVKAAAPGLQDCEVLLPQRSAGSAGDVSACPVAVALPARPPAFVICEVCSPLASSILAANMPGRHA